jgi:RNA polymerase sigma-70 factor (ECF subfamily)
VTDRETLERAILERLDAGNFGEAATKILQGYGPELFGFLMARLRDDDLARDAFSRFTEDLWRGLPSFERRSSLRVWAYTLARHAAIRERAAPHRRRNRNVSLDVEAALTELGEKVRTETAAFLKTEFKSKVALLRDRLSEEERTLLVLRVDRRLEWTDVARVFLEPGSGDAALRTEAARIRKKFQLIKAKIRRMAEEEGLVTDS